MTQQMFRTIIFVLGMLLVTGCEDASVDAGADKTVQVNNTVHITATAKNTNGATIYFVWKEGSTVVATTASFDYTPTTVGEHTLSVTGTDGQKTTNTDEMVVTVTPAPNELPTADAGSDMSVQVNDTASITGSGTDTDGSIVSYQWKEGADILAETATFTYTPVSAGTHTLTLTVTDNDGATASDTMSVTANALANQLPTANAGADLTVQVNQAVTVTGSGIDTDGTIDSYQWKEGATILSNSASFSYTPSTVGPHTLTLTVTDNNAATASDSMTVTATEVPNQAPTANAGADKTVEVNQAVTVTGSGTDTDGTIDSYQWKEGATILSNSATFSYTPSTVGPHTLTLTVTDNGGATASDAMTVTATEVPNQAPTANAGADVSVEVNQTVSINGSATDTDGSIVSYEWKEGASVVANTATFSYTPTTVAVHTLTLTVTDDDGATASDSMTVTATKTEAVREQPLVIIRVEFNDYQFQSAPSTWSSKIFGNNNSQLNNYMNEVSYGSFQFLPAIETDSVADGMITVHLNENHPGNLEDHIDRLATAAQLADPYIDYSQYDSNGNGALDRNELQIMFLVAGGERATGANPGIWAHKWCMYGANATPPTLDGVSIMNCTYDGGYSSFGEKQFNANTGKDATIGVIAHELGHAVFNLPDLYDTNGGSEGIGNFGLIGSGSWAYKAGDTQPGMTPVHMTGWSKIKSGFVTPIILSATQSNIAVASTTSSDYALYKVPTGTENEYFLIENRDNSGYDRGFYRLETPGSFNGGLLVLHIDDNQAGNQDETHKLVDVEEANGAGLDNEVDRGKSVNLFFAGNKTDFSPTTTPNSNTYNGTSSGVSISNISTEGSSMSLDIEIQ